MPLYSQSNEASLAEGVRVAETTYTTAFGELGVNKQPGVYEQYVEKISASSEIVNFNFVSNYPQMREWTGARIEKFVRTHQMAGRLRTYEATMRLRRKTLQYSDQNIGLISQTIRNFLQVGAQAYDQAAIAEFMAASNLGNTCFDGSALFSATHAYGSAGATWSNLAAGTNYSWQAQDAGRQAMREFRFESGEPAGMNPTHLFVGPKLERVAKEANQAKDRIVKLGPTGAETTSALPGVNTATLFTNIWAGEMNVVVDNRITDYTWTLADLSKPGLKPIFFLEGEAPRPQMPNENDPELFWRDDFVYGIRADYSAIPGHPICVYRGTGTGVG